MAAGFFAAAICPWLLVIFIGSDLVSCWAHNLLIVKEVEKVEVKYIELYLTPWPRALATNQCFSLSNAHMKVGDRYWFNNGTPTKINSG